MSVDGTSAEDTVMAHVVDENDDQQLLQSNPEQSMMELDDQQTASEPEQREVQSQDSNAEESASDVKRPPKMRLKLSMRKLPTLANRKPSSQTPRPDQNNSDDEDEVRATVVDSDDGEENAVVAVIGDDATSQQDHKTDTAATSAKPKRRTIHNPSRQIRLPPIASPGLYMAPPSVVPKDRIAKNGLIAPADVFDYNMELAGYTRENRTKRPHRGSSVTRTIGDMFDSNVALAVRFPPLIPPINELQQEEETTKDDNMEVDGNDKCNVRQNLIDALTRKDNDQAPTEAKPASARKRHKPLRVSEMVPVSLAIKYPEDFIAKQIAYVDEVNRRERAIIEYQDARFLAQSSRTEEGSDDNNQSSVPAEAKLPHVPPIPDPPTPPALKELTGLPVELYRETGRGPVYFPKGKEDFVAHLDPNCFHITEGRYFGLASNFVADPNFVGPNAPGIAGMNASGGSGLATSSSGGGISGAMALTLSTTYNGTTAGSAAAFRGGGSSVPSTANHNLFGKSSPQSSSTNLAALPLSKALSVLKPSIAEEVKDIGQRPTATYTDLKKIFDDDGLMAQSMKDCIIKAAVHASRSGHHAVSWLGPDGEIYPDISKAFATYAGVKPCHRCKSNKQGAYHCRLRRKHKEMDHDGGNSTVVLSPLLLAPMESLLSSDT